MPKSIIGTESSGKQMQTEKAVECPLCKVVRAKFLCEVDGYQIWRCPRCTLDFVYPAPSEQFLKSYYDREVYFESCERGGYHDYDEQTQDVVPTFLKLLAQYETTCSGRYILDVGCAYGTHLAIAAERGWKAFGVEHSAHALQIARERHGSKVFLTDKIEELEPNEFDLILLLDVIEHIRDPFSMFFKLFSKGAIGPKTQIVITTPNARSYDAVSNPAKWAFRHPPTHLFFYSAESLKLLMTRLQFRNVAVSGLYRRELSQEAVYDDESSQTNRGVQACAGLLCGASGSEFKDFKHFPRYLLAQKRASGARVLDFGCGVGHGSALLADTANEVLGVDIDVDPAALHWASQLQRGSKLTFQLRSDLGKGLPAESFDIITCFEVFEHLDEKAQREFLENASRLLAPRGELLISAPNLVATASNDKNPGRLGKVDNPEFRELLGSYFRHVRILGEWMRPSIVIADQAQTNKAVELYEWEGSSTNTPLVAMPSNYVAICSQQPIGRDKALYCFDSSFDYVASTLAREKKLYELQFACHGLQETTHIHEQLIAEQQQVIAAQQQTNVALQETNQCKEQQITTLQQIVDSREAEIAGLKQGKLYRLSHTIRNEPLSLVKVARIIYLVTGILTPRSIRRGVRPVTSRIKTAIARIEAKRAQARAVRAATRARKELAARIKVKEKLIFEPAIIEYVEEEPNSELTEHRVQRAREITSKISHVSVVVLTRNAGPSFSETLKGIKAQQLGGFSSDITVIDCCSTDGTVALAREQSVHVVQINPARFDHGLTRNLAFRNSSGDAVVFLSQHAVPGNAQLIQQLIKAFDDPLVAGVYGQRVPPPTADIWARKTLSGWPADNPEPETRFLQGTVSYDSMTPTERYQLCNFDDVCCAIRRLVWREIPFRAAEFAEGLDWSKRALEAGWKIAYQPAAVVVHSHERFLLGEFRQTYLLHKTLFKLFGLSTVPSLTSLSTSILRTIFRDSLYAHKHEPNFWKRISRLVKLPALNLVTVYAQYRGARDARIPAKKES